MAAQDAGQGPFHWHYGELDDKNFKLHRGNVLLLVATFAALLVLTLFCVYLRWACRYRRPRAPALSSGMPRGLDHVTISSFPLTLHRGSSGDCSICLNVLVEGEKVRVLPGCKHEFHPECVDEWLKKQSSCPLCRAALGGTEAEAEAGAVADVV